MKEVIYIGNRFYTESGTIMSSVYLTGWVRYDYGFLKSDLEKGESVFIRPACAKEIEEAEQMLLNIVVWQSKKNR